MSEIGFDIRGFRYRPLVKLASGGMATVYLGALDGPAGFRQIVAIKRPHPHLLDHAEAREAALAEARIAARFRHANVVDVRDVEVAGEAIQLVMDYIEGATLSTLLAHFARKKERIPTSVTMRILLDACAGLAAVHELADESGAPLGIVHRDISPQNILVGVDGVARVSDFGTVKEPAGERPLTTQGTLKGKPGYMAPEYVQRGALDARSDELALAVVAWEALTSKRLFRGATDFETFERVLRQVPALVGDEVAELGRAFDAVIARALAKDPEERFATVRDFAGALAKAWPEVATAAEVGQLVWSVAGDELRARREELREALARMDAAAVRSEVAPSRSDVASAPIDAPMIAEVTAGTPIVRREVVSQEIETRRIEPAQGMSGAPKRSSRRAMGIALGVVAVIVVGGIAYVSRGDRASDGLGVEASASTTSAPPLGTIAVTASTSASTSSSAPPALSAAPSVSATATAKVGSSLNSASKKGPKPPPPNPY